MERDHDLQQPLSSRSCEEPFPEAQLHAYPVCHGMPGEEYDQGEEYSEVPSGITVQRSGHNGWVLQGRGAT